MPIICSFGVGSCWIGHGSHINAGATIERSVLFEFTRIPNGTAIREMIVSPDYCVDRAGHTIYRGNEASELRWGDARG